MIEIKCPLCAKYGNSLVCPICKGYGLVHQRSSAEEKKRRNDLSIKCATKRHLKFTEKELKIIRDPFYSTAQAASILKRSIKSIENARYRLRKGSYHEKKKNH